jgi:uracil-DNA glycosylase
MTDWESTQREIQVCRHCEERRVPHLRVPAAEKRKPPWEPVPPVRLYFVSVAPPWGGAYFWDETARDAVREGLFRALRKPLATEVTTCRQFRDLHLFLTPAVKCPSAKAKKDRSGQNKDHAPSTKAVKGCARFLRSELEAANPERVLALGAVPFRSLCEIFGVAAPKQVDKFAGTSGGFGSARARCRWRARISPGTTGTRASTRSSRTSSVC